MDITMLELNFGPENRADTVPASAGLGGFGCEMSPAPSRRRKMR